MPSEQESHERGFPCARRADNGHVGAGLDGERRVFEDRVSTGAYRYRVEVDAQSAARRRRRRRAETVHGFGFLERAERLEETQREVALGRVLPRDLRDLLSEQRNVERPVGEEERTAALVPELRAREEQPRREPESGDELHGAGGDGRSQQSAARMGPFDEQRLLLAGERALGAVRLDRNQAEERVEIEAGERSGVRPLAQVALSQPRLCDRGDGQRRRARGHGDDGDIGIEQRDADRRQHELERGPEELRAEVRQLANLMRRMRALGHVGRGTALEVSIGQARDLAQERGAQARFQPASKTERHGGDRQLEEQQDSRQRHERGDGREPLAGERQVRAEVEEAPEKQRLRHDAGRREEQCGEERQRRHDAVGPHD